MPERVFFFTASLYGFIGVAAGAFGAHALKARLAPDLLAVFETASRYQLIHALALFAAAWAMTYFSPQTARAAAYCFIWGVFLFSGSLYLLALTGVRVWGAVTPIGGLLLLSGWLLLAVSTFKKIS